MLIIKGKKKMGAKRRYSAKAQKKKNLLSVWRKHVKSLRMRVDRDVDEGPASLVKRENELEVFASRLDQIRCIAAGAGFRMFPTAPRKKNITKATLSSTRRSPKYECFVPPSGLQSTDAHVTHPQLKCTFLLEIIGVKKNLNGGVLARGTRIKVDVSKLNSVTPAGEVVWGKYARVTNDPEIDGCVNAVSLSK